MKKILIALVSAIALVTLSSFVINKHYSQNSDLGSDDVIYYKTVTAQRSPSSTETVYIFYREYRDVRQYLYGTWGKDQKTGLGLFWKNPYYKSSNDFRAKYKYCDDCHHLFFNCDLPYYNEEVQHRL